MKQELEKKSKKKERDTEARISELIETHLQMPGFIEIPGAGSVRDSLRSSQEQVERAPYKVLPDYIRHIEGEVKQHIRDLKKDLIEQGTRIRTETAEARKKHREELLGDIATGAEATKSLREEIEAQM